MNFKVGDIIVHVLDNSLAKRINKLSGITYYTNNLIVGKSNGENLNSRRFIESEFRLATRLELYLLGLTDENDN